MGNPETRKVTKHINRKKGNFQSYNMDYSEKCHCLNENIKHVSIMGGGENLPHPPLLQKASLSKQIVNLKNKVEGSLILNTRTMSNVSNMKNKRGENV